MLAAQKEKSTDKGNLVLSPLPRNALPTIFLRHNELRLKFIHKDNIPSLYQKGQKIYEQAKKKQLLQFLTLKTILSLIIRSSVPI